MESIWSCLWFGEWRREVVEQIPVYHDHPEYQDAPPSQLNLKVKFTGLEDPFPFVIMECNGESKEMTRGEAEIFCDTLAKNGNEKTKQICRAVREKLREQPLESDCPTMPKGV